MTYTELPLELKNEITTNGIADADILRMARRSNQNGHHVTIFTADGGRFRFRKPNPLNGIGTNWRLDMTNEGGKKPFNWD